MFTALALLSILSSLAVRWWMLRTYARWSRVSNAVGATGMQVARYILDNNRLQHVQLQVAPGQLSDHYLPGKHVLRLSESINQGNSVASAAVAAHEVGHAIQDAVHYPPLRLKAWLMPLAAAGNQLGLIGAIGGALLGNAPLSNLGLVLIASGFVMPVLTLPIEFDASRRALAELTRLQLVSEQDYRGARAMLRAAAMTYVASAASSLGLVALLALRLVRR